MYKVIPDSENVVKYYDEQSGLARLIRQWYAQQFVEKKTWTKGQDRKLMQ